MSEVRSTRTVLIVTLAGEIDMAGAPALSGALSAALSGQSQVIVVECDRLAFIDIVGARPLAAARRAAKARGVAFYLLHPAPRVLRVLDVFSLGGCIVQGEPSVPTPLSLDENEGLSGGLVDLSASAVLSQAGRPYLELPGRH